MGTPRILGLPQGGRNRAPLQGANPMESLRTLMGLQSPSNVAQSTTGQLEDAQGLSDYAPGEADLMAAQQATGGSISRESIRSSAMQNVRQQLAQQALKQQQHEASQAREQQGALDKQRLENEGRSAVARIQGDSKLAGAEAAAEAKRAAIDALLKGAGGDRSVSVSGLGSVGAPPRQNAKSERAQTITEGQDKRLIDARSANQGFHPMDWIQRKLGGTPSSEMKYDAALISVLTRMGVLGDLQSDAQTLAGVPGSTLDQRITAAGGNAAKLHPYEREWLQRKLGLGQ